MITIKIKKKQKILFIFIFIIFRIILSVDIRAYNSYNFCFAKETDLVLIFVFFLVFSVIITKLCILNCYEENSFVLKVISTFIVFDPFVYTNLSDKINCLLIPLFYLSTLVSFLNISTEKKCYICGIIIFIVSIVSIPIAVVLSTIVALVLWLNISEESDLKISRYFLFLMLQVIGIAFGAFAWHFFDTIIITEGFVYDLLRSNRILFGLEMYDFYFKKELIKPILTTIIPMLIILSLFIKQKRINKFAVKSLIIYAFIFIVCIFSHIVGYIEMAWLFSSTSTIMLLTFYKTIMKIDPVFADRIELIFKTKKGMLYTLVIVMLFIGLCSSTRSELLYSISFSLI